MCKDNFGIFICYHKFEKRIVEVFYFEDECIDFCDSLNKCDLYLYSWKFISYKLLSQNMQEHLT